ncbi:MAG: PAS domain-containing protein [Desulfobacteraceae bacterium]|nr:MAG: PAS domain-containing protein [Desulfobacteraceae bacterium]
MSTNSMNKSNRTRQQLLDELQELTSRLMEAEEAQRAILNGEVDCLVVPTMEGDRIFSLSGADHFYRVMVETLNEGAVTVASDGTILFCNHRFADIVQGPLEKVIGSSITKYISSIDRPLFERLLEQGLYGGSKSELSLLTGDERSVPVYLSISALRNSDMFGAACIVVTDLTEQKRNEEMLAEEKLTTQILNQAAEIFIICDPKGWILRASQSACILLGGSLVFKEFDEAFRLRYTDGTPLSLLSAISEKDIHAAEVHFNHGDNRILSFLLSANSLKTEQGVIGIIVVMVDITERKKLEDMLQQAHDKLEQQVKERTAELAAAVKESEKRRQKAETAVTEIQKLKDQLETERAYLQEEIKLEYNHEKIIGQSDGLKYVLYKVEQIASSDTTVLVLGETGTGKELVARAIHSLSQRKNRALVKVNCAALPSNLIESELFGHEKGAFTGSNARHIGRFEIADGTTLFLDEIGELPLELQPKLLRVLQDGEFERLGGSRTIKVNARIIAATNRNLEEEVRMGNFREDLWYRLNIFPITMPPLRDRIEDMRLLVDFYVKKISKRLGKTIEVIPVKVMNTIQDYHWPGNIRELENVLERAVINSSGPKLRLVDELKKSLKDIGKNQKTLEAVERDYIIQTLEQTHWKVGGKNSAAEILGLDRSTLRARMRKLNIQKD